MPNLSQDQILCDFLSECKFAAQSEQELAVRCKKVLKADLITALWNAYGVIAHLDHRLSEAQRFFRCFSGPEVARAKKKFG